MQLRCLHANSFSFEARDHDPASDDRSAASADLAGSIVVIVAVEQTDANSAAGVVAAAADQIAEVADQLDEQTIVLVPCSQLTDVPASQSAASEIIDRLAGRLAFETHTVPIGAPISFDLDARGHPFANQSFEIEPAAQHDGEWFLFVDDSLTAASESDTDHLLDNGQLVGLISLDRLTDPSERGPALFNENGTILPEGVFLRDCVADLVTQRLRSYGAVHIERPPATGASTGLSASASQSVFETTANTGGGDRRVPTLTTGVSTLSAGLAEANAQIDLVSELLADLSVPFEPVCRVTGDFLDEHRDRLVALAERFVEPLLLESRRERDQPFRLEFDVFGEHSRLVAPAVWLDNDSGDGSMVVRSAPVGDPIRFVAALCRTTGDRDRPQLPTWLAPVQCRLLPLEPDDTAACSRLADQLESTAVRVDIDDRNLPVSERLDAADEEWIPYDAVVGADDSETLRVTSRAEQTEWEFTPAELASRISEESADWPAGARPVPRRYSDRPNYS